MAERARDPIKRITLKDGTIRYRFVVDVAPPGAKRDQRTYTYDKLGEARTARAKIMAERDAGTLVRRDRHLTVADWCRQWLAGRANGRKPSTLRGYADALKPVLDAYGDRPLQSLRVADLESLRDRMHSGELRRVGRAGEPLSARSCNVTLTVLGAALKAAVRQQLVAVNVAELVERVPTEEDSGADRNLWDSTHAARFLAHVADDRYRVAWTLALCGLRRGEVAGLRWEDVDLHGEHAGARGFAPGTPTIAVLQARGVVAGVGEVIGSPKGKGRRGPAAYLPLPRVLVDALKATRQAQVSERLRAGAAYGDSGYVVADELGRPPRPEWLSDRWKALCSEAGVPVVPLHAARHAAASLLADHGIADVLAARWLGHAQVRVTHGYTHAMTDRLHLAAEALDAALSGAVRGV